MRNPHDPVEQDRFTKAVKDAFKKDEPFRQSRTELIDDYAGDLYGEPFSKMFAEQRATKLVNTMFQTAEAYMVALAGSRPQYLMTTEHQELLAFSRRFQDALNNLARIIHLEETLQACTLDAFFGPAFAKVFPQVSPQVEHEFDIWAAPGRPHAARLSLDDVVRDVTARDFRAMRYMGDKYEVPEWLVWEVFAGSNRDKRYREAVEKLFNSQTYRRSTQDRTRDISNTYGDQSRANKYEDMACLADFWFPTFGIIATYGVVDEDFSIVDTPPLDVYEWNGFETGPYHYLNLGPVPDNMMPSSPALHIKALYELSNAGYAKTADQLLRQKSVGLVESSDQEDAKKIINAKDGDVLAIKTLPKEGFAEARYGGVDNNTLAGNIHIQQLVDRFGGNVVARAGLGSQAGTAQQEQMILGQISRHEGYLSTRTVKFAREIGTHLAQLLFEDRQMELPSRMNIPGTTISVRNGWTPDEREGTFADYIIDVEPYSMAYRSPEQRMQAIDQFVQLMAPVLPLMMQSGVEFDWYRYIQMRAELTSEPRLAELFRVSGRRPEEMAAASHERTMQPHTVRENVRRNVAGGAQDPQLDLMNRLLSSQNGAAA